MLSWLLPSVIATSCGTTLLTGVFSFLFHSYQHKHLRLWASSYGAYALRLLVMLVIVTAGDHPALRFLNQSLALLSGTLLLAGTLSFIGKETPKIWWTLTAVGVAYIAAAIPIKISFMALALPTFTFLAVVNIWSGVMLLRHSPAKGLGSNVTGWALILWGLHKADYPWLRGVDGFAPWGYLIASVLAFVVALGILVTYFEALRVEQERLFKSYRALIEMAPYGISVADPSTGILLDVNTALAEMAGRRKEDLIGAPQSILHPPSEYESEGLSKESSQHIHYNLGKTMKTLMLTADGVRRNVEVKSQRVIFAGNEVVQGFFRDVTESLAIKSALEESERKYRGLFEEVVDIIHRTDENGVLRMISPSSEPILGYRPEEILGLNIRDFYAVPIKRDEFLEKLKDQGNLSNFESQIIRKDGSFCWTSTNARVLYNKAGMFVGVEGVTRDITQTKQYEESLKDQKYLLEMSQEIGHIGTWNLDLIENNLIWTDENYRIFGMEKGSIVNYEIFLDKVHPEDRDYVNEEWAAAINGKPYDIEHRLLVDGEIKWVREKADLKFNENGSAVSAIGFTQDITERKGLEQDIRKEDLKYRRFLQSTRTAPWEIDLTTGEFTFVGQQIEDLLGYPLVYWRDTSSRRAVIHPDDQEWVWTYCQEEIKEGRDHSFTYRAIHQDGRTLWIQDIISVLRGPSGPEKLIGFMHDVTQREEAVRALEESEERFQRLFNEAPLAYQSLDVNGVLLEVNESWLNVLGYEREEVIGRSFAEFLDPEFIDRFHKGFPRFKARGEVHGIEHVMRKKTGERVFVSFEGKVTYREDGSMRQTHCILNDVTQAKAHEEERRAFEDQLRQAQKLESIGTLAGGIAHDFNNILSAVLGYTELTIAEVAPGSDAEENLQEVLSAARRAKALVTQILTFSRKARESREPVQLHRIVGEAMRLLRQTIPTTIEISQDISQAHDVVFADPNQLHQIVMNLCTNAYHAMKASGGVLSVALTHVEVDALIARSAPDLSPGPYARLSVADTGAGMAPETIAKIFEPFFTTKPAGEGTGMGMAVVHGIVKSHRGAIKIESHLGRGTRIHVYLPCCSGESADEERVEGALPKGTERVMVVDDEPALAKVIAKMLQGLGYIAEPFSSSVEALEAFQRAPSAYDLVITDQTMPEMSGGRLTQALLKQRADLPIIICTGYSESMSEARAIEIGARELLLKPMEQASLARAAREALDRPSAAP